MARSNVTKVKVGGEALAKALKPLQNTVERLEAANTGKEVNRLMAEYGSKKASSG